MEDILFFLIIGFIGLIVLIIFLSNGFKSKKKEIYNSSKNSKFIFQSKDIQLIDDTFHGSEAPRFTEWWYFDAIFNNGYSVQMSVRIISIIKNRFVPIFKRLDIYKDGELLKHNKIRYSLKKFDTSKDHPLVKLEGKQVIKGEINESGKMVYTLNFEGNNTSVNLSFEGCTKGWKGRNPSGDWWAVILPRAKVNGIIKIGDEKIKVNGLGYHDHNWDVRASAARNNIGWFWGKLNFITFTITWATIFNNKYIGQPILVINEDDGIYINIKPENIDFKSNNLQLDNGKFIPYHFILKAKSKNVDLNVTMDVIKTHHVKMMLRMHYWRYHLLCRGYIIVNNKKEIINETQIAEFLKFK